MQTTLLGLAIAIILALLAALVGPLLIDWGSYRTTFEAEASRLVGAEVRIAGDIDVRLLPSPQLTLHELNVGSGGEAMRARSLAIEFALGALMRGQWRASELHLSGPQVRLSLDAGRLRALALAVDFDPDAVTIERLSIADGSLVLADVANGASVTLDRLSFAGDARSLLGPFKGEGAVSIAGERYPYRINAGRYADDGTLKLRVNVDPAAHPLGVEADGVLTLAGGAPKFEGSVSLARPVGIASGGIRQPWRVNGKVKTDAQGALFEQLDFQYGSEERGLTLTGVADFKFGKSPRFDGVLSGRQIDLDRALAADNGNRPLPATALRELAELARGAFRPHIPIQIGVGIDQITLGGSTVQNLRGDIGTDSGGWNLNSFEFRAPGHTQVRLSGHLAVGSDGATFTGPAEINAGDPRTLAAWLAGSGEVAQGDLRALSLRGEVTVGSEKIAIERLQAEFDRRPVSGRLVYVFAAPKQPAKLEAELSAPELDLDAVLGFSNALLAGSSIETPHDLTIAADIGRASMAGFVARKTSVRLKVDGNGLQVDRLLVDDLGGARISLKGRIVGTAPAPHGSLQLDLNAPDMTPVMALLARFAPDTAEAIGSVATGMAPAKLQARLTIDGAAAATQARLGIDGSLGKVRLALNGQTEADPIAFSLGDIRLDARLDADDGKALIAMLGLDRVVTVNAGPAALSVKTSGPLLGDQKVEGWLTGAGLEANLSGGARILAEKRSAALRATIVKADLAPLRALRGGALPVALTTRVTLTGDELSLADINGTIAGSRVKGQLAYGLTSPHRLRGDIDADEIDGVSLLAAAIGLPPASGGGNASLAWSSEPFTAGAFGDFNGKLALKVRRFDLLPQVGARDFRAALRLGNDEIALDDAAGDVAGGALTGQASFRRAENGLTLRAKLSMSGAEAAGVIAPGAGAPINGKLDLAGEVAGTGLSPVALIGALQGSIKFSFRDAKFAGLDPHAFDAIIRAVDDGLPIEPARIVSATGTALASGPLPVEQAEGTIAIGAGQARLGKVTIDSKDASLSLSGNLDLTDGALDARMVLSGTSLAAGARPDIFMTLKGPVTAPARGIDVAALTAWLTLREVENQSKRLREMERQHEIERAREIERAQQMERARQQSEQAKPPQPEPPPPQGEPAPALPAPIEIRPVPAPLRSGAPAASVGPQN